MSEKKQQTERRQYDAEFKRQALQMIADGRSVVSVSQALGVSEGVLYNWRSKAKKKSGLSNGAAEAEIKELRKRLKEAEKDRDILKKALSIFSRVT